VSASVLLNLLFVTVQQLPLRLHRNGSNGLTTDGVLFSFLLPPRL
jgi:hypothetical protein